jgi:succinate dehydrogenase/fumarate reductase flavoprotein subunit
MPAGEHNVVARKGVVLASGGFEGSDELTGKFMHAPFDVQVTPAGHEGDAVTMSIDAGADLEAIDEAWWMPAMQIPGELLDGQPISRLVQGERALPHTIIVNSAGERFANEAAPYNHFGRAMRRVDEASGAMPNGRAWMVFDDHYRRRYGFFDLPAGCELPDFVVRAATVEELAERCGIDVEGLVRTVDEFNPEARAGRDPWFQRGQTKYERFFGDNTRLGRFSPDVLMAETTARARIALAAAIGPAVGKAMARMAVRRDGEATRRRVTPLLAGSMRRHLRGKPSGTLGPIDTAPYYAVPVNGSTIGTVGGPRIDPLGRVLAPDGRVIDGLYAAGNAAGCPTRGFYGGAGGTITLAMTFGFLAGEHAAGR